VIVGMVTIGVVGLLIDRGVRILGAWMMPWSRVMSQ
jgi:ABC-type nitrate/sulfonate/bicarbonate transport system permease component